MFLEYVYVDYELMLCNVLVMVLLMIAVVLQDMINRNINDSKGGNHEKT